MWIEFLKVIQLINMIKKDLEIMEKSLFFNRDYANPHIRLVSPFR